MQVTATLKPIDRKAWRAWLQQNHTFEQKIWILLDDRPAESTLVYLDAVEEAICFGWIDGIAKRVSDHELAQRFTPRRPRSNWTELNQERARRLIRLGLMTEAGRATLPDLETPLAIADDIVSVLQQDPVTWENFSRFPELYQRIRIGYIEEMRRNPDEFDRRLRNFIAKTAQNKLFGNWNDGGRLVRGVTQR